MELSLAEELALLELELEEEEPSLATELAEEEEEDEELEELELEKLLDPDTENCSVVAKSPFDGSFRMSGSRICIQAAAPQDTFRWPMYCSNNCSGAVGQLGAF